MMVIVERHRQLHIFLHHEPSSLRFLQLLKAQYPLAHIALIYVQGQPFGVSFL
jgi:hypothetical protein